MRGSPAGGELAGETDAVAVRDPTAIVEVEASRSAGGGEPAVDLVDAEADDTNPPVPDAGSTRSRPTWAGFPGAAG